MHIFIHFFILFIFIYALLILNIPQIAENSYIKMKLYLFTGIFVFEFVVILISKYVKRCVIDVGKIISDSLKTALLAVIGYSIYTDLIYSADPLVTKLDTPNGKKLVASIITIVFVFVGYLVGEIFSTKVPEINDCINKLYE